MSYASEDRDRVAAIVDFLQEQSRRRGWRARLWWDRSALLGGEDFDLEIRAAIGRANVAVACVSEVSLAKLGYVRRELSFIIDRARLHGPSKLALIPVRLEACRLPPRFEHVHAVDGFSPAGLDILATVIENHRGAATGSNLSSFSRAFGELTALLEEGNLKGADQCTARLCDRVVRRVAAASFGPATCCAVLRTVDDLWQRTSSGTFGFSRQASLWSSDIPRQTPSAFAALADAVGWRVSGDWVTCYDRLTFTHAALPGHLPSLRLAANEGETYWWEAWRNRVVNVHARFADCPPVE